MDTLNQSVTRAPSSRYQQQPTMVAPICFVQALVFITDYQGNVLHLANDINPTVRPVVAQPRATPTVANELVSLIIGLLRAELNPSRK
jgi:hypothetical protein